MIDRPAPQVVLASTSSARATLLRQAGVVFEARPARIDETEIKTSLHSEGATAAQAAESLAELKARAVSRKLPGVLVIGADQILTCDGVWYDKPPDLARAAAQLAALRGKTHELSTSVCVMQNGTRLWHHNEAPRLTMRAFSDAFIAAYLEAAGSGVLASVGAYQLEGPGVQLFSRIEGDFFAILGLPLLPLLEFLRAHEVVAA